MNNELSFPLSIPPEYHGKRVDVVLAALFPQFSRTQLGAWLKEGIITVNGSCCKPKDKVLGGETLHCLTSLQATSAVNPAVAEDIPIDVLFEDEHFLILNKPAGLVVHPGTGNASHTLVNALLHYDASLEALPRAGIIHRLDKDTTGLLLVGKTLEAYTALARQMQAREIDRHYKVLVHGHLISGGIINTCYGRSPRNRLKMAVCKHGKEAITTYSICKQFQHTTLLDIKLLTGRTHQIRVHMQHIKHPVVGDPLYKGQTRMAGLLTPLQREALLQFPRQALHACTLTLTHPFTEEIISITTPLPEDFEALLIALEPNDA